MLQHPFSPLGFTRHTPRFGLKEGSEIHGSHGFGYIKWTMQWQRRFQDHEGYLSLKFTLQHAQSYCFLLGGLLVKHATTKHPIACHNISRHDQCFPRLLTKWKLCFNVQPFPSQIQPCWQPIQARLPCKYFDLGRELKLPHFLPQRSSTISS